MSETGPFQITTAKLKGKGKQELAGFFIKQPMRF